MAEGADSETLRQWTESFLHIPGIVAVALNSLGDSPACDFVMMV